VAFFLTNFKTAGYEFSIYFSLGRQLPSRRNANSNEGPVFGHLDGRRCMSNGCTYFSTQPNDAATRSARWATQARDE